MGEQHFCLRWNHHQSTLVKVFDALLQDESLVDVTLYAEGRPMRAHKVVLSACSSYFQEVFANHTGTHPVIILKDILYSELRALIDYMYRGEVSIGQQQLGSLIRAAESLQVKGLADGSGAGGVCGTQTSDATSFSSQPLSGTTTVGATGQRIQQQQHQQQHLYHQHYQQIQRQVNGAVSPSAQVVPPIKRRRCPSPQSAPPADGESTHQAPTLSSMLLATRHNEKAPAPNADGDMDVVNITASVTAATVCADPGSGAVAMETIASSLSGAQGVDVGTRVVEAALSTSPPPPVSVHVDDVDDMDGDGSDAALVVATSVGDASAGSGSGDDSSPRRVAAALPNIPATITPVTANGPMPVSALFLPARPESPATPELDLSIRSTAPEQQGRVGFGPTVKMEEGVARSDGEQEGSEGEAAGPSGGLTARLSTPGEPTTTATALLQHGLMKWPINENASSDALPLTNETGAAQDAFLQRALNARFQQLLQQQRYDQLLAARGVSPVGVATGGTGGGAAAAAAAAVAAAAATGQQLPLFLKRESPTSPGKQYPCDRCGRHYASSGNLKRHVKYECGVEPQFQCPICKKKFQHRHSVKIHVVSTHKTENPELIKEYLV